MSVDDRARRLRPHPGEYEDPDDNATVEGQRNRFLSRLAVLRPEVLQGMTGKPLELYRRAWRDWRDRNPESSATLGPIAALMMGHLPGWSTFKHANPEWSPPHYIEMRDALRSWSEEWHLVDDWILDAVVETLALWAPGPQVPGTDDLRFRSWADMAPLLPADDTRFTFTHPGWQPTTQRWADVRKEIEREIKRELVAYELRIRDIAEAEGWVRVKDPRFRKGDPMDWVVTRLVDGKQTYEQIAFDADVTRARTHAAVKELAAQMGLTLPD